MTKQFISNCLEYSFLDVLVPLTIRFTVTTGRFMKIIGSVCRTISQVLGA